MDQEVGLAPMSYATLTLPTKDSALLESIRVEVLPIEPGHVMSREKYEQLLQQQKQK